MPIESINHYNLRGPMPVLEAMRDWYQRTLGMQVGDRPAFNNRGFWLYGGGAPLLHLTEEGRGESHPVPGSGTFDHVAFTCTGYETMRSRLDALGEPYRTADVPLTRTRQIFLRDPAGNGVELNFDMD